MGIPDDGRTVRWNGYDPSVVQKVQEADTRTLVHRKKRQTGFAPLQPPAFYPAGIQHNFLEFRIRKVFQATGPQGAWYWWAEITK